MIIKHVYLDLNGDEYERQLVVDFGFRTRYICNFIERGIRSAKIRSAEYDAICMRGTAAPMSSCEVVPESALRVPVAFSLDAYQALTPHDHHEFYISMLQEGFARCCQERHLPSSPFAQAIDDFRRARYVNEWTHKSKMLEGNIKATLQCHLDCQKFVLTLILEKQGRQLYHAPVLETKPDEIIFAGLFKDVVSSDGYVTVTDKFGDPTFSLDLALLERR